MAVLCTLANYFRMDLPVYCTITCIFIFAFASKSGFSMGELIGVPRKRPLFTNDRRLISRARGRGAVRVGASRSLCPPGGVEFCSLPAVFSVRTQHLPHVIAHSNH